MARRIPARDEVRREHTWNAESVFATPAEWEREIEAILSELPRVRALAGRLADGAAPLAQALEAVDDLRARLGKAYLYAGFSSSVDTTNSAAGAMQARAQSLEAEVAAGTAFVIPELLAIGEPTLRAWQKKEPRLAGRGHFFDDLFRRQAHVRSEEVEEVLGMLSDPFSGPSTTASLLTNADFKFRPARDRRGRRLEVSQGSLNLILGGADRTARRTAWESYLDRYVESRNALASNLSTSIRQSVFQARVRRHRSTLTASLFEYGLPEDVFHNLIEVFRRNLPTWHRYFRLRRQALGLRRLHPYDMWAPLGRNRPRVPFARAVGWICEGLAPMGEEYVETIRRGCLEQRWVDIYPNRGKRAGAFSWGVHDTHPFILMSYNDQVTGMSTLAHELGHSMHSHLTRRSQPIVYHDYSLFAAEVASNFHQAMVRAHLLRTERRREVRLVVVEEAISNFYRYFFLMPTLARFELEMHRRAEENCPLTADDMCEVMADLFEEAAGGEVAIDRPRLGMTWATFGHLFRDYYVYAYATGISGAHALAGRVLRGEAGAVDDVLGFLKSGASRYPLDALRLAGVDLARPEPVEEAFAVLSDTVDRLAQALG